MQSINDLLALKLKSLVEKSPFEEQLWELELDQLLKEKTSLGKNPNQFLQFRDSFLIKKFVHELLEQKINPNHQTYDSRSK